MLSPSPSASHRGNKCEPKLNATPDLDDDDDANSIIDDTDVDVAVDVDVDEVLPTQKPHFLDDAMPPPEMIADFERVLTFGAKIDPKTTGTSSGEQLKMDKKYERDGEISDYELAASGYTKKEFTQDDNTLNLPSGIGKSAFTKPKHFLDENPIPPDYMLLATIADHDLRREHRSLDRNFERQEEQQSALSAGQMLKSCSNSSGGGRKSSLDRGGYGGGSGSNNSGSMSSSRTSRERSKDLTSSYTLSRFLHSAETPSPPPALQRSIPKGGAWASSSGSGSCSFDRLYGSLPMAHTGGVGDDKSALGVDDIVDVDRLGPKVECVYSLLSMLGSNDPAEMSKKFLELSRTPETCSALRRAGCVPLLVQMMHSDGDDSVRKCSTMALHNVVHSHLDEKTARRETKVLRLLEQILDYCNFLKTLLQSGGEAIADDSERHPLAAISSLMKVSFDEEHRHAMCELGALQAIPNLVHLDHAVHGPKPEDQCCNSLRRYALMALTNLTFGDEHNKAYLCSQKIFMEALVAQLDSAPDDLLQVTASVLRNLSWRADSNMKAVLNEIGTVTALARAAMKNKSENTLKAILSALWNLSAHCSTNKAEFCAVDGALAFLVDMLTYEGPSKTLKIIENAGGILRNVSSHIAVREHYRQILRERNCLSILLQQLKSESLTVVSNSCGTLWNLSARCPEDQKFLWDNGAVPMLRSLIHSKHAMISEGSASALKNLLNFRPAVQSQNPLDPIARSMGLRKLPTLNARKQKALQQELGGKQHAETCDNLDISGNTGVTKEDGQLHQHTTLSVVMHAQRQRYIGGTVPPGTSARLTRSAMLTKSESRDSVFSAKSDTTYENLMRSHSASDANRKKLPYTAAAAAAAYSLENDVEATEVEQPIDYSAKYCEKDAKTPDERTTEVQGAGNSTTNVTYQETDLDQPTDFSLRYAEHQIESDLDVLPNVRADRINSASARVTPADTLPASAPPNCGQAVVSNGNEILLILEDTVKCYQTEDTPYVISNAASVTDLRQAVIKSEAGSQVEALKTTEKPKKYQRVQQMPSNTGAQGNTAYGSGSYTPEKPINYCEEGTPGYFSRYESLSSLDESPPTQQSNTKDAKAVQMKANTTNSTKENAKPVARPAATPLPQGVAPAAQTSGNATAINSAQETPLMFSRHSSMDSLVEEGEEEIGVCDDKSSVVSDFSRLASGVISPSEIPDSPTQSLPQSPRRNSNSGHVNSSGGIGGFPPSVSPLAPTRGSAVGIASSSAAIGLRGGIAVGEDTKRPLCSVFEDDISTFHVENTPAQFSCRTSLSNLSILDDEISLPPSREPPVEGDNIGQQAIVSEGEEEEAVNNIDDILLANCINMGMNRTTITAAASKKSMANTTSGQKGTDSQLTADEPKHYYTEDTPALLSKVGSNTNLSAISICSSNNMEELKVPQPPPTTAMGESDNRHSLVLSDDVSSNASESGAAGQSFDLLQQCIEVGMKKPTAQTKPHTSGTSVQHRAMMSSRVADPIAMLRRGGNILPPYLPVADETNKFLIENSPCNFSVASGLSNLTVGSSLVGPAVQLKSSKLSVENAPNLPANTESEAAVAVVHEEGACMEQKWQDDSLSSLSIDSEDDTNLLSQAIAAGCNRPKSNLGFSSTSKTNNNNKRTSLSASQPIPINAATSSSSLNSSATARHYQRQEQQTSDVGAGNTSITTHRYQNGNDSYSSVDSSDSNDNQAKSLFELCIRTGMHKPTRDGANHRRQHMLNNRRGGSGTTQSNPNLKQFDSLPLQLHAQPKPMALPTNMSTALTATTTTVNRHLRERERKDEKLLLECINTGISKKIGSNSHSHSSSVGSATVAAKYAADKSTNSIPMPIFIGGDVSHSTGTGSKNVLATSAAAQVLCHPHAATLSSNVHSTAAPDVAKMNNTGYNSHFTTTFSSSNSNNSNTCTDTNNSCSSVNCWETKDINNVDIIDAARSPAMDTTITAHSDVSLPNHVNAATDQKMNDTGYKEDQPVDFDQPSAHEELNSPSVSFDNTVTSDDSNESFIIETTVSLEMRQSRNSPPLTTSQKHKDPDLMLKSVERLTLEFVSSAEQLRTNATSVLAEGSVAEQHRMASGGASISIGGTSNSNNTWNEDTCPNDDVSFPSVSVTAPIVASLNYDDNDDDDDEDVDQATEADHKDLHDFAEITPINEEQPQPSLLMLERADTATQPSSLETETETDTLVNDGRSIDILCYNETQESTTSSGINFQLGGAVQSAALSLGGHHMFYGSNSNAVAAAAQAAAAAMTNSTIIAIEARALAENLQHGGSVSADDDDSVDLTFSINSLDLDNIRPPSGMESLNMSGYYHQEPQTNAFHSLGVLQRRSSSTPQSPQMIMRSPKFPRKSLPQGLVAKRALGQLPAHLSGSAESVNSSCNLLENIKPPSLMDELLDSMISVASIQSEVADAECSMATTLSVASNYETAAGGQVEGGDYDDNTITLQSCYETMPHDMDAEENSFHSGAGSTPLPTDDCEFSSAESTPQKSAASPTPLNGEKRTLTPKQKRKVAKDRYRTFTISSNVAVSEEERQRLKLEETQMSDETLQIEIIETETVGSAGSSSRRRSDAERYRTQTIVYNTSTAKTTTTIASNDMEANEANASADESAGPYSLTSTDDCASESMCSLRAMTQKFKFINMPINISKTAPEAEAAEVRGVPDGGDCTSIECDQNSETESCHDQHETYGIAENYDNQSEEDASDNSESEEHSLVKSPARARITKPTEPAAVEDVSNNDQAKAVRGRKKPIYISPYSIQYQRTMSPQTRIATNKTLTPTKTAQLHTLRKRDTNVVAPEMAGTRLPAPKKVQTQVSAGAQATTTQQGAAPPSLDRQGTFVQEEPTITTCQVPVVVSDVKAILPPATATAGGSPQRSSKLPTKRATAVAASKSTTTSTQPAITRKIPIAAKSSSPKQRKVVTTGSTGMPQRSNSNAAIRVTSSAARVKRVSATTPPTRSNSNLNSRDTVATAAAHATKNAAAKINQAQSRIANIWKRVNDAKSKQQEQQRVPRANAARGTTAVVSKLKSQQTKSSPALNMPKKAAVQRATQQQQQQKKQTLIRSSTFDNTPNGVGGALQNVSTKIAVNAGGGLARGGRK
ncbi:adenomatous polyposis coli protein [Anastrepha obliqua]|uniref:adenomatous polyposis coli protein n=1 Tax=Anastrepha obliqua TaxID=95512 RepID=UPI0024091E55|nr:adenomatous polyposis coli protein [Anastrepha obliqua]XP_054726540.1 adenomatous polyposis coli protein [Anastrepha obliqua]